MYLLTEKTSISKNLTNLTNGKTRLSDNQKRGIMAKATEIFPIRGTY